MILSKDLRSTERSLRTIVREMKQQRKSFPAFKIMRTVSRGKEIYCKVEYRRGKRKRTIIDYGGREFFDILKGLVIDAKCELAEEDTKLIADLKKKYRDISAQEVISLMQEKYPRLDRHDIMIAVSELEDEALKPTEWALSDYVQSDYLPEEKIHTTSRGLKVRSKSELIICEIFYRYGIEFRYEEVMYINGRRLEPDFTIRRRSDGKIFYWEHCGMMDKPRYRKRYFEKRELYEFCDIVPWDNMIFTYDKDGSIDSNYIEAIVKTVLLA